jgi:galactokinase
MNPDLERLALIEGFFSRPFGGAPSFLARAPGRVDLMGSHPDYNLGFVLTPELLTWYPRFSTISGHFL